MNDSNTVFSGSVPGHYHAELGSLLFEPYALELAGRMPVASSLQVLETACGTGILTRRLAEAAPQAELVATDLNPGMLSVARDRLEHTGKVAFAVADMTSLPFENASFDLVMCQFGLMFVPDKPLAAREAHRVLRRGGGLILSTWAPMDRNPIVRIAHETIVGFFPVDPPRFYETPFSLDDPTALRVLLEEAGFDHVRVETVARTGCAEDARTAAIGLVEGNPVADAIRARGADLVPRVCAEVERRVAEAFGHGTVQPPLEALVATASA